MTTEAVRFFALGDRAAVVESPSPVDIACQQKIWWMARELTANPAVIETVPGMNNLTVLLDLDHSDPVAFLPELEALWGRAASEAPDAKPYLREIEIPVMYGGENGPDLADVAKHAGLTEDEVVAMHSGGRYIVYFLGFQPGFCYMGGLDDKLATPRRAEPRLQVAAGSVGIGGSQTGIYPAASPGGWNLIGRTTIALFDPTNNPPTYLQPGDLVRFVPVEGTI